MSSSGITTQRDGELQEREEKSDDGRDSHDILVMALVRAIENLGS